jgi:hypothetical protein
MTSLREGGCCCGTVRYRLLSEPYDPGWCHCRTCQLVSGAPAMAFATVPRGDFEVIAGGDAVANFASSSFGRRKFCALCGTPLLVEVDHQPDTLDFSIATLDDPDAFPPAYHIFRASKVGWFETIDDAPRHDRFRPDTRGLAGTEPPG